MVFLLKKKALVCLIFVIASLCGLSVISSSRQNIPSPTNYYVNDFTNVMSAEAKRGIEKTAAALQSGTGA